MIIELSKHKDSHAWGRNGAFIPAKANVNGYRSNVYDVAVMTIDVDSSKAGKSSPLKLRLTVSDAMMLQAAIGTAIREASAK